MKEDIKILQEMFYKSIKEDAKSKKIEFEIFIPYIAVYPNGIVKIKETPSKKEETKKENPEKELLETTISTAMVRLYRNKNGLVVSTRREFYFLSYLIFLNMKISHKEVVYDTVIPVGDALLFDQEDILVARELAGKFLKTCVILSETAFLHSLFEKEELIEMIDEETEKKIRSVVKNIKESTFIHPIQEEETISKINEKNNNDNNDDDELLSIL